MDTFSLVSRLCSSVGPSGHEDGVFACVSEYLKGFSSPVYDKGSIIARINESKNGCELLIDAHLDEISLIVTRIDDDGFLRFSSVGGIDRRILPASQVTVHASGGDIPGIICSLPPHLQTDEQLKRVPKIDELAIDIGFDADNSRRLCSPGDYVSFFSVPERLLGDRITSKALDDRAGCAAVLTACKSLAETGCDCGITMLLSSREEIGGIGAATGSFAVAPTHAVAVDVSFAKAPGIGDDKAAGDLGGGVYIGFSPILDSELSRLLMHIADREGIPHVAEVMGGRTSTNADEIASSRCGVKTALLSIPQRNMHTPVEIVSLADIDNTAKLIVAFAKEVK